MKVLLLICIIQATAFALYQVNDEWDNEENDGIDTRIIKGSKSENPGYIAYLNIDEGNKICGGILITSHYILTAANCVYQASSVKITLNITEITDDDSDFAVVRVAKKITIHEKYGSGESTTSLYAYDIALIEMNKKVTTSNNVITANLADGDNDNPSEEDDAWTLFGWGKIKNTDVVYSKSLMSANTTVKNAKKCNSAFNNQPIVDDEKMICTSSKSKAGACLGDNGGPLIDTNDGKVYGVICLYDDNCEKGSPTVYAKVSFFIKWISDNSDYKKTTTTASTMSTSISNDESNGEEK